MSTHKKGATDLLTENKSKDLDSQNEENEGSGSANLNKAFDLKSELKSSIIKNRRSRSITQKGEDI